MPARIREHFSTRFLLTFHVESVQIILLDLATIPKVNYLSTACRRIFKVIGGTAADAAVALLLCTCVALPNSCGLGGGLFAITYNK